MEEAERGEGERRTDDAPEGRRRNRGRNPPPKGVSLHGVLYRLSLRWGPLVSRVLPAVERRKRAVAATCPTQEEEAVGWVWEETKTVQGLLWVKKEAWHLSRMRKGVGWRRINEEWGLTTEGHDRKAALE